MAKLALRVNGARREVESDDAEVLALLARTPRPSEPQVRDALAGNLCRCGTHARVIRAVLRAAAAMNPGGR